MCIQNALQITDIIKDKYYPHSSALYLSLKKSAIWMLGADFIGLHQ